MKKFSGTQRRYNLLDTLLIEVDGFCQTVFGNPSAKRENPARNCEEQKMDAAQQRDSSGFMRVNHTGEVCAQALYRGHALVARDPKTKATLEQCSDEENDHLAWCDERLQQLNSHQSYLNIFWYLNSFTIGVLAGIAGDEWSLGFVEETEKQVAAHLASHLKKLPLQDHKSRAIVTQMKQDEIAHGQTAQQAGAKELPGPIKKLMGLQSKLMTSVAYWC